MTETGGPAITPLSVLRNSAKLSGANLASALAGFLAYMYVARVLGPEMLGVSGFLMLWLFYANLLRPGLFSAAMREMPHLLGQGKAEEARRIQNIALTVEVPYVLLPVTVMLFASLFYSVPVIRHGLPLIALAYLLMSVRDFVGGIHGIHRRFGLQARVVLVSNLVAQVFVVASVRWLGIYSVLLDRAVAATVALTVYRLIAPPLRYAVVWGAPEARRLLHIGLPMTLLGVFYWGFRTVDQTLIAVWLPFAALGYFTFALNFANLARLLVSDFGNVLAPVLFGELGRRGGAEALGAEAARIVVFLVAATSFGVNAGQAALGPLVLHYLPRFAPAVPVVEGLIFVVPLAAAALVPSILLNSVSLNRQRLHAVVWGAGLALNALLGTVALRYLHWGPSGVAWATVTSQMAITAGLFAATHRYLAGRRRDRGALYGGMLGLLAVAALVFIVLHVRALAAHGAWLPSLAFRLACVAAAWAGAAAVAYGWWRWFLGSSGHPEQLDAV